MINKAKERGISERTAKRGLAKVRSKPKTTTTKPKAKQTATVKVTIDTGINAAARQHYLIEFAELGEKEQTREVAILREALADPI